MTNYEAIKSIEEMAEMLIEQEFCEKCFYNKEGLCVFDADKESITMYMVCYNAAILWLKEEQNESDSL